ncbi:MAG: DNA polymerase Y family protein, partial [Acidimicrobiales bacterium]
AEAVRMLSVDSPCGEWVDASKSGTNGVKETGECATRVVVVWCPDWPIVARGHLQDEEVAVVHANRVVACTSAARDQGVHKGLRRREAQRRCPSLLLFDRDLPHEAREFEAVVGALEDVTPRVEIVRPGMVVFVAKGPTKYFGGEAALAQRCISLVNETTSRADAARVGIADGVFAASLAARQAGEGGSHIVGFGGSAAFLAPFPVRCLDRPELSDVLVRLGLRTLGSLAQLDEGVIVGRFGSEGEIAHRLARGLDERPPAMSDPPPEMEVSIELDPVVERVDQAAFVGKVLADEMFDRLTDRGASCSSVVIKAETEHGEELVRFWRHEGALTAASIADRVRWQLDGWLNGSSVKRPSGGLSLMSVRPDSIQAATGRQLGFWGGQTRAVERAARAVARVQGVLGPDAVTALERRGGRSPREQVVKVPADSIDLDRADIDAAEVAAPWPGGLPGPSPTRLHNPRIPIVVVDRAGSSVGVDGRSLISSSPDRFRAEDSPPGGRSRTEAGWVQITEWAGPWPLEERWWDSNRHRRQARLQVVEADGGAHLFVIEAGQWWLEATYD